MTDNTLVPHWSINEESGIDPATLGFAESRMALQVLRTDEGPEARAVRHRRPSPVD